MTSSEGEKALTDKEPSAARDLEHQDFIKATAFYKFAFFCAGFADLFFWNCVLNILYDIRDKCYSDYPSMTDTLNAVNNLSTLIVALYTVKTGAMNLKVTLISGVLLSVACLLTAITVQWVPGIGGVVLLHIANVIAGACSGFYQTGACGLASVVGEGGLTGYVSAGQGATGVVTFVIWIIISKATSLDVKPALWILMAVGCVVTVGSNYFLWIFMKKPEIARRAAEVRKSLKEEATNPDAPSYRFIMRKFWLPLLATFWCMYMTLFAFPNIGPINWGEGDFTNVTLGMFQVGDLIGRYLPNIMPFITLSIPVASALAGSRIVLFVFFILCWKWPGSAFWGAKAWHIILMLILSITNGWIMTSIFIKAPSTLPQEDWRSRAMSLIILAIMFGISGGLWSARIFTAINVKS